jgi:hypothetical protein
MGSFAGKFLNDPVQLNLTLSVRSNQIVWQKAS